MPYQNLKRQVLAEINLNHFIHNLTLVKQRLNPQTQIMLVLKADAYGHGALQLAKVALEQGINYFAVATFEEAMRLREQYQEARILILGYTLPSHALEAIKYHIEMCVYDIHTAKAFSKIASIHNMQALLHIKLDTGMGRLGYQLNEQNLQEIQEIFHLPHLRIQGIFTHFATADCADSDYLIKQYTDFQSFLALLPNLSNVLLHCANSASIFHARQTHMDIVRLGIIAYGLQPSFQMNMRDINLKAVMSFKANIVHIKEIDKYQSVSYGRTFVATKRTTIATLPVGYADGYMRLLSNKAEVLIHGKRAPIVGNICMDHCMVDISEIDNVKVGDCVLLFGYDEYHNELNVDELAARINTINYELVCAVSKRVPRVYTRF
ncbi:alanine racemase [Helicobacter aurati]|uniref:Alanine racemase n=1 Tax=Helicobacter aurati TaxID=137778 RepID=A0A3D8J5D4_9HELI|nr:alanine racemase [Helicobacter aurati]RDU72396.1 alanine racemase [Helicobacter aurati]